ncbi:hypothetical protein DFJ43DRAFT_1153549 [Lentinula guzmanii]|uniref:Uncharacterized protein n=4 Tax=Lentinula TaxID=5352 RepID=A0AA38N294_9AGAR|nr:hypothetical protein DFJ43DRAFT_1153549 [Lentinula guzmanii]KAJ3739974.1 hypothetical protein DFH05DRAFT_1529850 [Lentinula detonsa]KAJ3983691.1 hypothetical protein F5890DRAFT_1554790 [Lentinula detonsa]
MSSLPATEPIPTFITARIAARPRVIPLYATPILNRPRRTLSIHHVLPAKPYARAERNGLESPASTAVSSGSSTESGATANVGDLLSEPRLILIPPPNANVTVKSSGWHAASAKEYRKFARKAVDMYLDHKVNLSSQDSAALERAREHIEQAVPFFKAHLKHWGADTLLREQLKSKKDTIAKAEAKGKGKGKEREKSDEEETSD